MQTLYISNLIISYAVTCLKSIAFSFVVDALSDALSIVAAEAIFHTAAVVSTEVLVAPVFAAVVVLPPVAFPAYVTPHHAIAVCAPEHVPTLPTASFGSSCITFDQDSYISNVSRMSCLVLHVYRDGVKVDL